MNESNAGKQKFWAGEEGASGILPIARDTKRICLAWRSPQCWQGNCWGTIGGAIEPGKDAAKSATDEMREEVGYSGVIRLIPAYVFQRGEFRYYNFLGIVPSEFPFAPASKHSWETDRIEWFTLAQIDELLAAKAGDFHFGLVALLRNSRQLIDQMVGAK